MVRGNLQTSIFSFHRSSGLAGPRHTDVCNTIFYMVRRLQSFKILLSSRPASTPITQKQEDADKEGRGEERKRLKKGGGRQGGEGRLRNHQVLLQKIRNLALNFLTS